MQRLRVPDAIVTIVSFMVRYLSVVAGELGRMRIALASRGFRAHSIRSWPTIAASAGALFVRSFERGERVHLAMVSRGYAGRLPELASPVVSGREWLLALLPAVAGLALVISAHT
jgi:cobalt/nickel transport system permease protein